MGYVARFYPEAWVRDNAVEVDAEGPREWDVTERVLGDRDYWEYLECLYDGGVFGMVDRDDTLKDDPNAPEWVRSWKGPFTIRVYETD